MHLLAVCMSSSEECLVTASAHFKKIRWLGFFLAIELHEFFIYFEYNPLMRFMICKYFLPFFRLSLFIL